MSSYLDENSHGVVSAFISLMLLSTCSAVNIWNQSAIQLVGYSTEEVMGKVNGYMIRLYSCFYPDVCLLTPSGYYILSLLLVHTQNLVKEFITDEFKTAVQAVLDQALNGEETANFEFPLMTKGGLRLEVLLNATTRRDEQGNVIGVVGIGQDVSTFLSGSG